MQKQDSRALQKEAYYNDHVSKQCRFDFILGYEKISYFIGKC